ncbi:PadR family transcriptional regulator [Streptosporangium carneum]|uniref:PadR family transcriptional regulator n=1 Tax=Streptosporangium carneum TaxID=47481 RepID=A0A9W6HYM2_9ACTN|nr:PadR family transcriptional regulator [Streptosporangium carneum]GLK07973.1 PadR family transcriptional regulator [Streptosporangium carneum]
MSSTRVLLLGVLLDGPLHGYEVRRRLELMGTHHWANVAYGSIYHGLSKMADEGLLERVEEGKGGKTVYAITEVGRAEFGRHLLSHWWEIKPIVDPFQVALTFMDRLSAGELASAMEARAAQLHFAISMTERAMGGKQAYGAPRHIDECLRLNVLELQAQLTWLNEAMEKVKNGELP